MTTQEKQVLIDAVREYGKASRALGRTMIQEQEKWTKAYTEADGAFLRVLDLLFPLTKVAPANGSEG